MCGKTSGLRLPQEASRLVFVSVKNAKPRRKVAIPIPDNYKWDQFCQQVQIKLKIKGVGAVHLVTSGEKVTTLDELQDIDELHVEEATAPPATTVSLANGPSPDRIASGSKASTSGTPAGTSPSDAPSTKTRSQQRQHVSPVELDARDPGSEADHKYVKRSSGVRRSLQRVLPGLFAPTLPITNRQGSCEAAVQVLQDAAAASAAKGSAASGGEVGVSCSRGGQEEGRVKRRRRRVSFFAPRNLLMLFGLLVFLLVLLLLYSHMVPRLE